MKYIFDTNVLRQLFTSYYPSVFTSLWDKLNILLTLHSVLSVRETYNEIMSSLYPKLIILQNWARNNPNFFEEPTEEEQWWVKKILETPHYQHMIPRKVMLEGRPCADPFIIAKAKVLNGIVVTLEEIKPNAAKIPNVCAGLNIKCINLETFMMQQGWKF